MGAGAGRGGQVSALGFLTLREENYYVIWTVISSGNKDKGQKKEN